MNETKTRILVVDDEVAMRRYLKASLTAHDYIVYEAENGVQGIDFVAMKRPDLVILDLGLPDIDGLEVIRRLREWTPIQIIVLSVRDGDIDKISALDLGANDYLTKPFSTGELLARIRVALRPATILESTDAIFSLNRLSIDFARRIVKVSGEEIHLTPIEYKLLLEFVQNAGRVLTHTHLLKAVWGDSYECEPHLLRVNISNLRRKIEENPSRPKLIITEVGVGYRFHQLE